MKTKNTQLAMSDIISVSGDALCVKMDDERVALNIENNEYFDINAIGSIVWGIIEKQDLTIEQLCQQLYGHFSDDDPSIIKTDTLKFLATCQQQGTLKVKSQTEG